MSNRFAATYIVNKWSSGDGHFEHELLDLQVMFEHPLEEDETVSEYTDTYEFVTELLNTYSEGIYRVFIMGSILYSIDYYGEHDVDVEVEYGKVNDLPQEQIELMYGLEG